VPNPANEQTRPPVAAFIHSDELEQYHYPPECPFSSERAGKVRQTAESMGLLDGTNGRIVVPRNAQRGELLEFHRAVYVDALQAATQGHLDIEGVEMGIGIGDCPVFAGLFDYASLACGASLTGADLILSGEARVAFNPSGGYHHAHRARAAGFCYLNDVVLACMRLAGGGKRVMFIDIDAHHSDGVQEAFYDRSDVMTVSFHEDGRTLFPGTGAVAEAGMGEGEGYSVNVPLPAGVYDEPFVAAFKDVALPLARAYRPDVIVLEVGMDALASDPLTHMNLTNNAHARVIELVLGLGLPVLAVGGGGYNIEATVRGWTLAWSILCGADGRADDMSLGLGGVMLGTTEWHSGLRDRILVAHDDERRIVLPAVQETIDAVRETVFAVHGL